MPNYLYKCQACEAMYDIPLPITHDPKLPYQCEQDGCEGSCGRIMRAFSGATGISGRVFLGDWFKNKYGRDIGDCVEKTSQKKLREDIRKARGE